MTLMTLVCLKIKTPFYRPLIGNSGASIIVHVYSLLSGYEYERHELAEAFFSCEFPHLQPPSHGCLGVRYSRWLQVRLGGGWSWVQIPLAVQTLQAEDNRGRGRTLIFYLLSRREK